METELATQVVADSPAEAPSEAPVSEELAAVPDAPAAEPEDAPAPSPFASIHDPFEVLEHDQVKPLIDKRVNRVVEEKQRELQTKYENDTRNWEATSTARAINGAAGRLADEIRNENIVGAERLVAQLQDIAEKNSDGAFEARYRDGFSAGTASGANHIVEVARDAALSLLDERGKDEATDLFNTAKEWKEVYSYLKDRWTSPLKAEVEKLKLDLEKARLGARNGQGPNLASGASGTTAIQNMADADRRYTLPEGHPEKITHEQYREFRNRQ